MHFIWFRRFLIIPSLLQYSVRDRCQILLNASSVLRYYSVLSLSLAYELYLYFLLFQCLIRDCHVIIKMIRVYLLVKVYYFISSTRSLQEYIISLKSELTQSCPTLCDPLDCSMPGSSIHWIFQARILEWVAISFSRGSSLQPLAKFCAVCHTYQSLYIKTQQHVIIRFVLQS